MKRTRMRLPALLLLCVVAPALAQGKAPLKGDAAKGKAVFTKNCVICHNADGSGGKKLTAAGNASRDFRDPAFWASRTDEQVRATINAGVAKSGMIAWKGILKPQEIEDAIAYIKQFPKKDDAKAAPPVEMKALDSGKR
jgi:cytochrome c oxidase cbb3-type subunit III